MKMLRILLGVVLLLSAAGNAFAFGWSNSPSKVVVLPVYASNKGADLAVTGTASETELWNCTIPGGMMGPYGAIRISMLYTMTNSSNSKTVRIKFGGSTITTQAGTTNLSVSGQSTIYNKGVSAQNAYSAFSAPFGLNVSGLSSAAVNTANDQVLSVTGQLANSGENITIKAIIVEVLR